MKRILKVNFMFLAVYFLMSGLVLSDTIAQGHCCSNPIGRKSPLITDKGDRTYLKKYPYDIVTRPNLLSCDKGDDGVYRTEKPSSVYRRGCYGCAKCQ